jgi:HEAT repeat protein
MFCRKALWLIAFLLVVTAESVASNPQSYAARIIGQGPGGNEYIGTATYAKYQGTGYVITAYHNVYQTSGLWLAFDEGSINRIPIQDFVEPVAILDSTHDVAIFRCTAAGVQRLEGSWKGLDLNLRPVNLKVQPQGYNGARVIAIGNPSLRFLHRDITPVNYIAGCTVSEYSELGKRLVVFRNDPEMSKVNLLFLEGLQVTHGFSGGPVLFSASQFQLDDAELVGMVEGGDSGNGNLHSWAVPSDEIIAALVDRSAYKQYPPSDWSRIKLSDTTFSRQDQPFITLLQVIPWNTADKNGTVPLQVDKPTTMSITFRTAGAYHQLAASLHAPDGVRILNAPGVTEVDNAGLLNFSWTLQPSRQAVDEAATIDFATDAGQYSFRLPLNFRIVDESPKFDITTLAEKDVVGVPFTISVKPTVHYDFLRQNGAVIIRSQIPYISDYLDDGVITDASLDETVTFIPPILSLKMFNFAEQPIDVSEIRIDVDSASVNKEPFLSTEGATLPRGQAMGFENEGWGRVIDPVLKFDFRATEPMRESDWRGDYLNVLQPGSFDERLDVDLTPYLVGDLRGNERVWMVGSIDYKTEDGQARSHRFKSPQELKAGPQGGNILPEFVYNAILDPDKSGYSINIPVARRIVPGELEHLAIRLFSPKSAHYVLSLVFRNTAGTEFQKSKVIVDVIRARDESTVPRRGDSGISDVKSLDDLRMQLYSTASGDRQRAVSQISQAAFEIARQNDAFEEFGQPLWENTAMTMLEAALTDADREVRISAIRGLQPLGYDVVPSLFTMVVDRDPDVGEAAKKALHGQQVLEAVNNHLWANYLAERANEIDKGDLALLATSLDRNHLDTAARIYAWLGQNETANRLAARALPETPACVRKLSEGESPSQAELAVALLGLKAQTPNERFTAIHTLAEMKERAAPASGELARLTTDNGIVTNGDIGVGQDPMHVSFFAANALAKIGKNAASAVPALIATLSNPDENTVTAALEALEKIGWDGFGEDKVADLLTSKNSEASYLASELLAQLGPACRVKSVEKLKFLFKSSPSPSVIHALANCRPTDRGLFASLLHAATIAPANQSSNDSELNWATCDAIHVMSRPLLDEVGSYYKQSQNRAKVADLLFECVGAGAVPLLIDELGDANPGWKILAAKTLSRYGSSAAAARPKLTPLLQDSDLVVRATAQSALSRIGP